MKPVILLLVLPALFDSTRGRCGFPGQPRNGTSSYAFASPAKYYPLGDKVNYYCNERHLLVPSPGERQCVDGKWTNQVPQCVEIQDVKRIVHGTKTVELNVCTRINTFFSFSIEKPRRVYAVRIETNKFYLSNVQSANLKGRKDNDAQWQMLELDRKMTIFKTHSIMFILGDNGDAKLKNLAVNTSQNFPICKLELLVFHDECGRPEIPIHGNVTWNVDDPDAIYQCEEGYQLDAKDTRRCVVGKWTGPEPLCVPFPLFDSPVEWASLPEHMKYVIGGSIGLLALIVIIGVCYAMKKNRLSHPMV